MKSLDLAQQILIRCSIEIHQIGKTTTQTCTSNRQKRGITRRTPLGTHTRFSTFEGESRLGRMRFTFACDTTLTVPSNHGQEMWQKTRRKAGGRRTWVRRGIGLINFPCADVAWLNQVRCAVRVRKQAKGYQHHFEKFLSPRPWKQLK